MKEKLKSWLLNDQIFYGFMVIFVGISSFSLGRASIEETATAKPLVQIVEPIAMPSTIVKAEAVSKNTNNLTKKTNYSTNNAFVASKNGTRYYLPSCSGSKRIKPENLISFPSQEAAEAAGYSKAANCPGL